MDQGDEVWEKFGHNALLVRDAETGENLAWNWGLFDFDDVDFIPRFLRGTMRYAMGGMDADRMVRAYAAANRTVYANEVYLTAEQAAELDAFVRWNALPDNRYYVYDYFRDNCSTRLRDALDRVLDGALEAHFAGRTTPHSYRWHSRRLVQETLWIDQGLSYLLGTRGDPPRTEWELMFVPMELMRLLEGFEVEDGAGVARPLLGPREVLFQAVRPPTPEVPPRFSLWLALAGLAGGGALAGMGVVAGRRGKGRIAARAGLATGALAWGLGAGVLGAILVGSWFTDHVFIHRNMNVFQTSPLGLVLVALLVPALASRRLAAGRTGRAAALLAAAIAGLSLLAAIVQAVGLVTQGNGEVIAVALPVNAGLAWAALQVSSLRPEAPRARPGSTVRSARDGPPAPAPPGPA